jgi:NAD-dependent SIR2 family protein deacetylase
LHKSTWGLGLEVNKVQCNCCQGIFYELNESITRTEWAGSQTYDLRLSNCPHCRAEPTYPNITYLGKDIIYVGINPLTGESNIIYNQDFSGQ